MLLNSCELLGTLSVEKFLVGAGIVDRFKDGLDGQSKIPRTTPPASVRLRRPIRGTTVRPCTFAPSRTTAGSAYQARFEVLVAV